MKAGKYVATEVGGACSLDSLWQLVKTREETGVPCMMLENCCYGQPEMAVLRMVREGLFGELVHAEGGYRHDLRREVSLGVENRHYRFRNYKSRNGELYPTHALGPIAKWLNINRGNRFVSLVSVASKAAGISAWAKEHLQEDHSAREPFACGDVVTTILKTAKGETVTLFHDTSLPRPYSRCNVLQGTKGIYAEDCKGYYLDGTKEEWSSMADMYAKYDHPLWVRYKKEGVKAGHGGMDYLVMRAFLEAVKAGTDTPIDVYDTAAWMAVTCLSEASVATGGMPVCFPDFTNGKWLIRKPPVESEYSLEYIPNIQIPEDEPHARV
jgi:predicted dehydrogenase